MCLCASSPFSPYAYSTVALHTLSALCQSTHDSLHTVCTQTLTAVCALSRHSVEAPSSLRLDSNSSDEGVGGAPRAWRVAGVLAVLGSAPHGARPSPHKPLLINPTPPPLITPHGVTLSPHAPPYLVRVRANPYPNPNPNPSPSPSPNPNPNLNPNPNHTRAGRPAPSPSRARPPGSAPLQPPG